IRSRENKPFIYIDLRSSRVINGDEFHIVKEMSLPELSCHTQIIDSVCFLQLIRGNSNPVESLNYTGCFLSIDPQAKRRPPECIRYKLNLFSIICKKPWRSEERRVGKECGSGWERAHSE